MTTTLNKRRHGDGFSIAASPSLQKRVLRALAFKGEDMERIATIDVLRNWEQDSVEKLVSILNRNGIVCDVDGLGLSSTMIEAWDEECDAYLAENGYQGGMLETTAEFISGRGAVYVIYDSENITYEKAKKHIKSYAS